MCLLITTSTKSTRDMRLWEWSTQKYWHEGGNFLYQIFWNFEVRFQNFEIQSHGHLFLEVCNYIYYIYIYIYFLKITINNAEKLLLNSLCIKWLVEYSSIRVIPQYIWIELLLHFVASFVIYWQLRNILSQHRFKAAPVCLTFHSWFLH